MMEFTEKRLLNPFNILFSSVAAPIEALNIAMITATACKIFLQRSYEQRADREAIEYSTREEIDGGISFFKEAMDSHLEYRNESNLFFLQRVFRKIVIDSEGNSRLDIVHSSLSSRIKVLKKARDQK